MSIATVSRSDGSLLKLLPIFRAPGSCRTPRWPGRGSPPGAFPVSANQVSRTWRSPLNSDSRLGRPSSPPQRSPLTRVVRKFLWGFAHEPCFAFRKSPWLISQANYTLAPENCVQWSVLLAVARPTNSVSRRVAIFLPDFSNLWPWLVQRHHCVDFSGAALIAVEVHTHCQTSARGTKRTLPRRAWMSASGG